MAHQSLKSGYARLVDRINLFPQYAPPSSVLNEILKMLFSEQEAKRVSLLPIKPFTTKQAAYLWKIDLPDAQRVLDELASRAILLDIDGIYSLPPPMAGSASPR